MRFAFAVNFGICAHAETTATALLCQTAARTHDLAIYGCQATRPRCFRGWSKIASFPLFKSFEPLFSPVFRSVISRILNFFQSGRLPAHANNVLGVKMVFACISVGNLILFLYTVFLGSVGTCASAFWKMGNYGLLSKQPSLIRTPCYRKKP